MKHLITGLTLSMLSATALAGSVPVVSVPEPGTLGLFAVSLTALLVAKKFRNK